MPPRRQPSLRRQTAPGSRATDRRERRQPAPSDRRTEEADPDQGERRGKNEDRAGVDLRQRIAWRDDRDTARPEACSSTTSSQITNALRPLASGGAHPAQRRQGGDETRRGHPP